MTDPYQQQPGYGPQYGAPGTGPGMGGQGAYGQPQDGFGQQPNPYGQSDPYNQQIYTQGNPYNGATPPMYGQPNVDLQAPFGRNMAGEPYSDKSKLTAGLLELFLGGFGAGRFYLGYNGIAVAQLLVTIFTCGLGGIWPLIDAIMIFTGNVRDPFGRPLQES
ncbi:TM2 domain-containing membrane protein YozV [Nocardia sp. GAS34]